MIAKAKAIQHGHNAINYAVNKEQAEIIRLNFLPQNITPDAIKNFTKIEVALVVL